MIRKNPISWNVRQLCSMMDKGTLIFDNPNQRPPDQWDDSAETLLIDSVFRMWVPDIIALQGRGVINEKETNIYDVIDGKQRCHIFHNYRKDKFSLGKMKPFILESTGEEYNISGLKYSELPQEIRDEIDTFSMIVRPVEVEDGEDEEDVVNMITHRINNGASMSRQHMTYLALPPFVRKYIYKTLAKNAFFSNVAHFPEGGVKKSDKQMSLAQSIILAAGIEYKSFAARDVEGAYKWADEGSEDEKVIQGIENMKTVFGEIDDALEFLAHDVFNNEHVGFMTKIFIPHVIKLVLDRGKTETVKNFIKGYIISTKSGDPYRQFTGTGNTKIKSVEGRSNGLEELYKAFESKVNAN